MKDSFKGEIILYQTDDGKTHIQLREIDGTVWLSQAEMTELFQTSKQNISLHIQNIFEEGELLESATVKEYLTVQTEGKRRVERLVTLYRLEMILAVGYRVRSPRGTQFRKWATTVLHEYLTKGFALDDKKLKDAKGADYFDELLERIRDIRASEKRFYQKVRDLFAATSVDYDKNSDLAHTFFKTIQNKLLYAVTGHTAAELIVARAHPEKPHMGLTNWDGVQIRKNDTSISKNYLNVGEIDLLNRLTTMFLDFADMRAHDRKPITMSEWAEQTNEFLAFNRKKVLKNAGSISHEQMETIITERYALFEKNRQKMETISANYEYEAEVRRLESDIEKISSEKKLLRQQKKGNRGEKN